VSQPNGSERRRIKLNVLADFLRGQGVEVDRLDDLEALRKKAEPFRSALVSALKARNEKVGSDTDIQVLVKLARSYGVRVQTEVAAVVRAVA